MNDDQFQEAFGDNQPKDITGKFIGLTFEILGIGKPLIDYHECKSIVFRFEKRELYTPEFKVSDKQLTLVRIKPDCKTIHGNSSSYNNIHYNLAMIFDGECEFNFLKAFFEAQNGEYESYESIALRNSLAPFRSLEANRDSESFPKKKLLLELRLFEFLDDSPEFLGVCSLKVRKR